MNAGSRSDVVVLGGGAAGLMAAATAGQRGRRVLLLERSNKIGKKILMSGGGRCNFTNLDVTADHFICSNPHFVKSALSQYTQWDFIELVNRHKINYHEKTLGQLFCDNSAKEIVRLLKDECDQAGVLIKTDSEVASVEALKQTNDSNARYRLSLGQGKLDCESLIVATGGLSVPTLGGSGFGYRLAEQFGLPVHTTEASLVPFTLTGQLHELAQSLAGVSLPVEVGVPSKSFSEGMLFTHRGLSGPAMLQISNYWQLGESLEIDLYPQGDLCSILSDAKKEKPNALLANALNPLMPKSLVQALTDLWWPSLHDKPLHEFKQTELDDIAHQLHNWQVKPSGTEGYRTAEVTRGGVDVSKISSKTMQVTNQPGLYFIGEVLDVTGHLGGYNFQWAWSSGYVAGLNA